jgi:hypothetical protein
MDGKYMVPFSFDSSGAEIVHSMILMKIKVREDKLLCGVIQKYWKTEAQIAVC